MPTKILLADDSITIQKIVHQTFEHEPVELTLVGNGDAAIRKMHEMTPDLVLADIFMPGKTGYEVCEYVKQQPELASVPVILLVGAFEPFDEKEASRVKADDHLKKPFAPQMLVETIRKFVTFESGETKAKESTWPESSEAMPSSPPPVETQWHAEQAQVIPLTPPVDISRSITRPIVEEPPVALPPAMAREGFQESTFGPPPPLPPPVSEFTPFLEETETPLEISHVHQPAAEESVMETQRLVSEPAVVPPTPGFEPTAHGTTVAPERDLWVEHAPFTLEDQPAVLTEPAKEQEPMGLSEASSKYGSVVLHTPGAELTEDVPIEHPSEKGALLESTFPVTKAFEEAREVLVPPPLPFPTSELTAAVTTPEITMAQAHGTGESSELGSGLTDEFKEFQRELVRHAPSVLPRLGEEALVSFQPSPVEGVATIEEEVMGPPEPFIPQEETQAPQREQISSETPPNLAEVLTPPPLEHTEPHAAPPVEFAETPAFPLPQLAETPQSAHEQPAGLPATATAALGPGELSQEMIDAIAHRVVEKMSSRVVEEIAWEVVPEIAETLLRKNLVEKK